MSFEGRKLVLGEVAFAAFRQGKSIRFHYPWRAAHTSWFHIEDDNRTEMNELEMSLVLEDTWEIKQEPREFWITFDHEGKPYRAYESMTNPGKDWTKVREVLNENDT